MPDLTNKNKFKWIITNMLAGPGWVIIGTFTQIYDSLLASSIEPTIGPIIATEPAYQFLHIYEAMFGKAGYATALITTVILVILSQIKINVTNAYSGSLSWSNFFSRLLHGHPGRAIWLLFQVAIGLLLMKLGIFYELDFVLGYSNVAIAWIGDVVSDLVINKNILKISPPIVEFKRGHLYNVNPVGFISMIIASSVAMAASFGFFGKGIEAFSPIISIGISFLLTPIIAIITKGKYYIARESKLNLNGKEDNCVVCGYKYEEPDLFYCPYHNGLICSLCCTLEDKCHDMCKKEIKVNKNFRLDKI